MKADVRVEGTRVRVRGFRPVIERIADRLLDTDYFYQVEGGLYGHRFAEFCVRFEAQEAAGWFAALAKDELYGPGYAEPGIE